MLFDLVHKIQGNDHGAFQLQQLGRQVQIALNIGGVHNIDDGVRVLAHDEVPGHDLLHGIGRQGVDAGQIHHGERLAIYVRPALLLLHRDAGPVAHILVGAGKGVEQRGLAAVRIAHQSQFHFPGIVTGIIRHAAVLRRLVGVVGAHAAQRLLVRQMLHHTDALPAGIGKGLPFRAGGHQDLVRVLLAQGELVAPQIDLDGIPEGRHLAHRDLGAGRQAHIHQPPLDGAPFISRLEDHAPLPRGHVLQCFSFLLRLCPHIPSTAYLFIAYVRKNCIS